MFCKKHGDIGNRTIEILETIQVVLPSGKQVGDVYEVSDAFCLKCLAEHLRKVIGVATKTNE